MVVRAIPGLLLLSAVFVFASPASAADADSCDPATDVVVTVDPGSLDGEFTTLCVTDAGGRTALDVLQATGLPTESTTAGSPMLCRIDGRPTPSEETCGASLDGDGYWAFYVASIDGPWGYAQVGPAEYEVTEGEFVTFEYTPLSQTSPSLPDLTTTESSFTSTAHVPAEATTEEPDPRDDELVGDDANVSWQLGAGILLVVLVVAGAVLIGRRRGRRDS